MKTYRIRPEFQSLWGDCNDDTVVTLGDIAALAKTWEESIENLMTQVEATHE